MYIKYEKPQLRISGLDGALEPTPDWIRDDKTYKRYLGELFNRNNNTANDLFSLPSSPILSTSESYKPNMLVDTKSMTTVHGPSITEPYFALSYSWNQSGKIIFPNPRSGEDPERKDEGKHEIIKKYPLSEQHPRLVDFKGFIQEVCQDFGIRYIWFDQMCIDQTNPAEKAREIRQMHRIYKHAYCTLVLVPELEKQWAASRGYFADLQILPNVEWSQRVWTLEEAYMSNKMLFLGRDVHFLSSQDQQPRSPMVTPPTSRGQCNNAPDTKETPGIDPWTAFLYHLCWRKQVKWSANMVLWYAHRRTSTRSHDRFFALANMFPTLLDNGDWLNYKRPVLDIAFQFYAHLATTDLSILLFGHPTTFYNGQQKYKDQNVISTKELVTREWKDLLPTWTGINGVHVLQTWWKRGDSLYQTPFTSYKVENDGRLQVCSTFIRAVIKDSEKIKQRGPPSHDGYTKDGFPLHYISANSNNDQKYHITPDHQQAHLMFIGSPPRTTDNNTSFASGTYHHFAHVSYGLKATHFLPVNRSSDAWTNRLLPYPRRVAGWLSLTENPPHDSVCFILWEICYILSGPVKHIAMPVVIKTGDYYKSIGVFVRDALIEFDPALHQQNVKDFIII